MKLTKTKIKFLTLVILLVIMLLATVTRMYKLGETPIALSWDEAAVGYNGWAVANYGVDEWGKSFPLVFKSFGDDKHPVHIYFTAASVKAFGLSEFSIRLPSAIFGILNVLIFFFLIKTLFKSNLAGLIGALLMAVSPYAFHYSRFNHELNFVLFFFMLGLHLFYKVIEGQKRWLPFSVLSFGLSFITYHNAKIVVPMVVAMLLILYSKELIKFKKKLLWVLPVIILFIGILYLNPNLLGGARVKQTSFNNDQIEKNRVYQKTKSELLGRADLVFENYKKHFSYDYLFIKGDQNPRLAIHDFGQFYLLDLFFLLVGVLMLIKNEKKKAALILFLVLISPIPSSLVNEAPQSARAGFMLVGFQIIIAYGLYRSALLLKNGYFKSGFVVTAVAIYLFLFSGFYTFYLDKYDTKNAIEFQYGMKQIVNYFKKNSDFKKVYMTDFRSQPYIFYLLYLKMSPDEFLKSVSYNSTKTASYNTVSSFDRYQFGGWDEIESMPEPGVYYVVGASVYDGLRYKSRLDVNKVITHPDGSEAFYILSGS